jgi:hypothetical protein
LRCSISNVYLENHLKSNREVRRVRRVRDDGKHPGAIALLLRVSGNKQDTDVPILADVSD